MMPQILKAKKLLLVALPLLLVTSLYSASRSQKEFFPFGVDWTVIRRENTSQALPFLQVDAKFIVPSPFAKTFGIIEESAADSRTSETNIVSTASSPAPLVSDVPKLKISSKPYYSANTPPRRNDTSCAILFVGLPRSFKSLVLPSIAKHVVPFNPNCDYYVHVYNKTYEAKGRSGKGGEIDPTDIFLLEDSVQKLGEITKGTTVNFMLETENEFAAARGELLLEMWKATKDGKLVYIPDRKSFQKSTVENIVKQWHSIQSAWKLMEEGEVAKGKKYATVAVLRSDVFFATPIQVQEYQDDEVIVPGFAKWPVNDRLIYGARPAVKIWATQRFSRMKKHVYTYPSFGIHPETFLNKTIFPAIRNAAYSVTEHPSICMLRARPDNILWSNDCFDQRQESRFSVSTPAIAANYRNRNMQVVVEKTLGRKCKGNSKMWNTWQRELECPPELSGSETQETERVLEITKMDWETLSYEEYKKMMKSIAPPPPPSSSRKPLDACLIHVGKTAGSTISCVVGNIDVPTCMPGGNESERFSKYRKDSKLVAVLQKTGARRNWKHMQTNNCFLKAENDHLLVVTTRDPISRMVSSFYYGQKLCWRTPPKRNMIGCKDIYKDCYQGFEMLATEGLNIFFNHSTEPTPLPSRSCNMTCPQRALAFVTGMRQFWKANHHWHNYEYYFPFLLGDVDLNTQLWKDSHMEPIDLAWASPPSSNFVVALRNEYLAEDWDSIDILLGGEGTMGDILFNSTHLNPSTKQDLSHEALDYLCQALCMEIQYYKLTLWLSSNLNASDIEETMDILRQTCPQEPSHIRRCNNLPSAGRYMSRGGGDYNATFHSVGQGKPRLKPL